MGRTSASAAGRALVPTAPAPSRDSVGANSRACATFLAQLIATTLQAPQTRARRRAEPADAITVYAAASSGFVDAGRFVHHSM